MNNYIKYGLIAIISIYLITVIERIVNKDTSPTELLIEHATEKAQMQTKIDILENKTHEYELELLKIRTDIDNLSNDQVDSVWATIFD
jgi:hypothetical protein